MSDPFGPDRKKGLQPIKSCLPGATREERAARFIASLEEKGEKSRTTGATRFTTDYAVKWGRSKGWKLIDRETFDYRTKRHHDTMLGSDAMFDTPDGIVLVQGAGRYERQEHRQRFESLGGVAAANRRRVRFAYVEFSRETGIEPLLEEWWA